MLEIHPWTRQKVPARVGSHSCGGGWKIRHEYHEREWHVLCSEPERGWSRAWGRCGDLHLQVACAAQVPLRRWNKGLKEMRGRGSPVESWGWKLQREGISCASYWCCYSVKSLSPLVNSHFPARVTLVVYIVRTWLKTFATLNKLRL